MEPLVSIIIPCYKVEKYLNRCVESIVNQTLSNIEIILVDDGSPDTVPILCDQWKEHDKRIKVIHKNNEGLGMACNSGIDIATGKYIALIDSDDWMELDAYENMYETAEKYKADIVFCGIQRVDSNNNTYPMYQTEHIKIYNTRKDIESLAMDMVASGPSISIERRIPMSAKIALFSSENIQKHKIRFLNERKYGSEDLLFNLDNILSASCVIEYPKIFYNYFINPTSLSKTLKIDRFDRAIILREILQNRYKNISAEFITRINRMFIGYTRSDIRQICKIKEETIQNKLALLKKICKNPVWEEIKSTYPINVMPIKHKIFIKCIFHRKIILLYILSKI